MKHPPPESPDLNHSLSDNDRMHILQVFEEEMVPLLKRMDAKIGNLNCGFAGENYGSWVIEFRSSRSGFDIVGFEYDEHSRMVTLPVHPLIRT